MTVLDQPRTAPLVARWFSVLLLLSQLAIVAIVLLLVVGVYYANDLQLEDPTFVEGGRFDPKDQWPFSLGAVGSALHLVGYMTFLVGWLASAAFTVTAAGLAAAARPLALSRVALVRCGLTVVIGLAYLTFLFSSFGQHLGAWMAD